MVWWAGWCARSDPQILLPLVDELVALTMERNLTFWHAMGTVSRGWCLVMLGHGEQGYSLLSGDAASELRTTCFGPLVFTMLADASRMVGQLELADMAKKRDWAFFSPMITVRPSGTFRGNVRRPRATCYFRSARKLGVGSAPMSACLDTIAAAPGVPAVTPRIAGDWRVTCAVY